MVLARTYGTCALKYAECVPRRVYRRVVKRIYRRTTTMYFTSFEKDFNAQSLDQEKYIQSGGNSFRNIYVCSRSFHTAPPDESTSIPSKNSRRHCLAVSSASPKGSATPFCFMDCFCTADAEVPSNILWIVPEVRPRFSKSTMNSSSVMIKQFYHPSLPRLDKFCGIVINAHPILQPLTNAPSQTVLASVRGCPRQYGTVRSLLTTSYS